MFGTILDVNMKRLPLITELILFIIIAIFAIHPVENFDVWFHLKYGEHILETGRLPFSDEYSHTAFGQPAVPYEWLFQVILYAIYQVFGNPGVQILIAALVLAYTFLFRQILKEIFHLSLVPRMFLVAFSFVIGYDFWVERPQSAAYVLFMATLYLILKRVFTHERRRLLWLTIPIFFIWTNLHASMVLGLYLFFAFAIVCLIKGNRKTARDLLLFGAVNTLITLLPPLGTKTYQLLYLFFEKRDFIMVVISEWVPLYKLGIRFHIYLTVMLIAAISLLWVFIRKYERGKLYLFLPFIPLSLFVITGVRQTQFSMPVILLCLIPAIQLLKDKLKFSITVITIIIIIIFISFSTSLYFYRQEVSSVLRLYPNQAIPFIKANLTGNMFNEYHMGGYLLYKLGPEFKTFIDGRTDMFLPQVLPEYDRLINNNFSDQEFSDYFNFLVQKYNISWAILTTERWTSIRHLARILRNDSSWHLVFFDDTADIYVRNDGKNDKVTGEFAITSATPFEKRLYKDKGRNQAKLEYERMQSIAPSATSLNALGFMLLEEKKFKEAEQMFVKALEVYPFAAAPKMNLAELSVKYGDLNQAITLYKQAIMDDPERGLAYLRLGQLIIQSGGSKIEARKVWQKGLKATPDEEIIEQIEKELNK